MGPQIAGAGPTNPDISVVGDIRFAYSEIENQTRIDLHEVEIAFVGPVNPYASAEVYVGIHGGETFEIEEAKLILDRYLPGGLGLTFGRMLLDFGQLNVVHVHAFPFVERPLMHQEFFGEDGARDTGVRLDWLAPVDAFTLRATAGVVGGNVFLGGHDHDEEHEHAGEDQEPDLGVTGRVDIFLEPNADTALLLGASVMRGEHDPLERATATWLDIDAKARFDFAPNRILYLNAEGVFGALDETEANPASDPWGWFVSADLRTSKKWNLGGFLESSTERMHDDMSVNRYGAFVGMSLMEESTMFRLVGSTTDPDEGETETAVFLQVLFGMGPHRAHRY